MAAITNAGVSKNFQFGKGEITAKLTAAGAAGDTLTVQLPNNVKAVLVDAIGADGVFLVRGATTYSAKLVEPTVVGGVQTPGSLVFTIGSAGLAIGTKLIVSLTA